MLAASCGPAAHLALLVVCADEQAVGLVAGARPKLHAGRAAAGGLNRVACSGRGGQTLERQALCQQGLLDRPRTSRAARRNIRRDTVKSTMHTPPCALPAQEQWKRRTAAASPAPPSTSPITGLSLYAPGPGASVFSAMPARLLVPNLTRGGLGTVLSTCLEMVSCRHAQAWRPGDKRVSICPRSCRRVRVAGPGPHPAHCAPPLSYRHSITGAKVVVNVATGARLRAIHLCTGILLQAREWGMQCATGH